MDCVHSIYLKNSQKKYRTFNFKKFELTPISSATVRRVARFSHKLSKFSNFPL